MIKLTFNRSMVNMNGFIKHSVKDTNEFTNFIIYLDGGKKKI